MVPPGEPHTPHRRPAEHDKTPFGAIVVLDHQIVGQGTSSVIELSDPTAHAEVMALRHAGQHLGRHLMPDATMYASSQPCPMCLIACYWARIPQIIYAATTHDVATAGFEDLQLYRYLTQLPTQRPLHEHADPTLRADATEILTGGTTTLPEPCLSVWGEAPA